MQWTDEFAVSWYWIKFNTELRWKYFSMNENIGKIEILEKSL